MELRTYAGTGFLLLLVPAIRRLYPENNEARKQAIAVTWSSLTPSHSWLRRFSAYPGTGRTAC